MSFTNKTKVINEEVDLEITTPDGQQILVGADEDEVLIYYDGIDNFSRGSKNSESWTNKSVV